jgi:hypothetical protein
MNHDVFYDAVAKEIQAQSMVAGVWARAFSEANGAIDQARALYIRYRVAQLAEARNAELEQERLAAAVAARQKSSAAFRRFIFGVLGFASGALTLYAGIGGIAILLYHPYADSAPIIPGFFGIFICILFAFLTLKCFKNTRR